MNHQESQEQRACVAWFRLQYPHLANLLTHPANEGNGNRVSGAIHKAEGTTPGVPDLLLFLPAIFKDRDESVNVFKESGAEVFIGTSFFEIDHIKTYSTTMGLGIELKREKGRLSEAQQSFQRLFTAATYTYAVSRSFEQFQKLIQIYIAHVPDCVMANIARTASAINVEQLQRDRQQLQKILSKKE